MIKKLLFVVSQAVFWIIIVTCLLLAWWNAFFFDFFDQFGVKTAEGTHNLIQWVGDVSFSEAQTQALWYSIQPTQAKNKHASAPSNNAKFNVPEISYEEFYSYLRIQVIHDLINKWFNKFNKQPLGFNWNYALTVSWDQYIFTQNIEQDDALDYFLHSKLSWFKQILEEKDYSENITIDYASLFIPEYFWDEFAGTYLFKSQDDLEKLGYVLVSYRSRNSHDKWYRRYNIKTAFYNAKNLRVINPWEYFSLLRNIHYSRSANNGKKAFTKWLANVWDGEKEVYGGGICWAATAFYQGVLTNTALSLTSRQNHSVRQTKLYKSYVNWQLISTPWLDATIFSSKNWSVDFAFRNIRHYPVILAFNYDWVYGHKEEVFSLARPQDLWNFNFSRRYVSNGYPCYVWKINGKHVKSCYRVVGY